MLKHPPDTANRPAVGHPKQKALANDPWEAIAENSSPLHQVNHGNNSHPRARWGKAFVAPEITGILLGAGV